MLMVGQKQDRFLISLKDKKDKPMPYFNFYFDKVYDKRQIRDNIGTIQKGIANSRKLADLDKPLADAFGEYFGKVLPQKEGARKLSICFYDLFVGEQTDYAGNEETGLAVVVVDFVEEKDGKLYTIGRFAETARGKSGWDITASHDDRIKEAMVRCFNAFNNLDKEKELRLTFDPVIPTAALGSENPAKGIYISFADALNSNPADTEFYTEEKDGKFLLFSEPRRVPLNGYYGFSDGKDFYINLGKYAGDNLFYRAEVIGPKYFVFMPNRSKELLVRIAPVVLVGGAELADAVIDDEIPVIVDRVSGEMQVIDEAQMKKILTAEPEIWENYKKSPRDIPARKAALKELYEKMK